MTPPLAAATPEGELFRVGRRSDAWAWPDWAYAGDDGTFDNRYDDPEGDYRVLYASSQRLGAFLETLARFRVHAALQAAMADIDQDPHFPTIEPGIVPREWLATRRIGSACHHGPFADIGHSESIAHLRVALAPRLVHYGLDDLDAGDLRRRVPRRLTQEISRYVFAHGRSADGEQLLGIRYLSRLGDDLVNWALFEGTEPVEPADEPIAPDDPDLHQALATFDLLLAPHD